MKKERSHVVKNEQDIDDLPYEMEYIPRTSINAEIGILKSEKENVIKELVVLKGDHQKLILQMQHKQREINNLQVNERKYTANIKNVIEELNDLKKRYESEKFKQNENVKTISNLTREKKLLTSQISQLISTHQVAMKSVKQKTASEKSCNSEEEYEVEFISDHKIVRNKRKFLVRWKGFSPKHDCWVKEDDLNCPLIL